MATEKQGSNRRRLSSSQILGAIAGLFVIGFLLLKIQRREGEHLVFAGWGTVEEKVAYEALVAEYNRSGPRIPVVFHHVSWPYYEKIMVQTVGNNAPDIFKLDTNRVLDWARRNAIRDLTPLIQNDPDFSTNRFFPALLPDNYSEGRLHALPLVFSPFVLYYNKDLFDRAGLDYPNETWDWSRFLEAAQKLTIKNTHGETEQFGCAMEIGAFFYAWQAGGRFYDDKRMHCVFNSPETVNGLTFYADLMHKYHVSPGAAESRTQDPQTRFMTGRVGMITTGRWGVPWFSKTKEMRWGIAMLPKGPAGRVAGLCSHSIAISSASRYPDEAWKFARYLTGKASQLAHARDGNNIPAAREVAESSAFMEDKTTFPNCDNHVFLNSLPYTYPWTFPPGASVSLGVVERIVGEEMSLLTQGTQSPADTARIIQTRVESAIQVESKSRQSRPFIGGFVFWGLIALAGAGVVWTVRNIAARSATYGQG